MKQEVTDILKTIIHPETERNIVESGMMESLAISDDRIAVTLAFPRERDPFANSITKHTTKALENAFPHMRGKIFITQKAAPAKEAAAEVSSGTAQIKKVVVVASGKGGVGKSTVAANLAVTLASQGYKVGLLDADIYGPSQQIMFGVGGYIPVAETRDGQEMMIPASAHGVTLMSIGFFIKESDALIWRGPMATGALKQIVHQTMWGELDFLLIDMPPGTGDIHLTLMQELRIDGAIVVTTPQQIAVADARRGIALFRNEKSPVRVLGIVENMSWFTPAELPGNRYHVFGQGGGERLAAEEGVPLLGQIPLVMSVMDGAENGTPAAGLYAEVAAHYEQAAKSIVENLK